jgi:TRAP-type mannitol/chloroaromatic compound transport system permease small subunit
VAKFIRFLKMVDKVIDRLSYIAAIISGMLVLIMGFSSTYATIRRYIFLSPEPYSYEVNIIFLLACVVLAIAAVQVNRRQLRVDFVSNHFSEGVQDFLINIVGSLMAIFVITLLVWKSWDAAWYSLSIGETSQSVWREPLGPIKLVVPLGSFLLLLVLLSQFIHGIINLVRRIKKTPPNSEHGLNTSLKESNKS